MKMKELDKTIFEKIFDSKNGIYGKYKIIKDLGIINNRRMVRIKFITTGYETDIRYDYAVNEISVKDPYYPKSHGVACTGNVQNIKRKHKRVYDRWMSMISRCYNPNAKDYKRYGAIGVTVDPRWLCFENYLHDFYELPVIGHPIPDSYRVEYQVDKDYLQLNIPKEQRVYSKDTCVLISPRDNANLKLIDNAKNKVNNYFGVYKSYNYYYPTIMHNGNKYNLGIYDNEIAAANAYNYFYKKLNSNIDSNISTLNDVPYMDYEEFSMYAKRRASICPVRRLK